MHRVTLFEVYCRSMHIPPTTPLFRVFCKLSKQGCWFSFEKRVHAERKVCFGDFPSCLKGWKRQFFLIDRQAIPFAMPWRHQDSDVSDPFSKGEYNIAHAERLAETVIEPFQVPQGFLYALVLSDQWEFEGRAGEGYSLCYKHKFFFFLLLFSCFYILRNPILQTSMLQTQLLQPLRISINTFRVIIFNFL